MPRLEYRLDVPIRFLSRPSVHPSQVLHRALPVPPYPVPPAKPMCFTSWQREHKAITPTSLWTCRSSSYSHTSWHSSLPPAPHTSQWCRAFSRVCFRSFSHCVELTSERTLLNQHVRGTSSTISRVSGIRLPTPARLRVMQHLHCLALLRLGPVVVAHSDAHAGVPWDVLVCNQNYPLLFLRLQALI